MMVEFSFSFKVFIIRYQIKIGKEIKIGYNKYKKVDWWSK